ncbi:MAG: HAD family hydrolase [Gammaproteobacteria bacterium]|nr:HAD family hydrolase [Gammaproteobacteria bacterium]
MFLDRDGVINEERNYVHRVEDFKFLEGIFDLCRKAKALGMAIVVITNQAGIGRGYYTETQFLALTHWMCDRFDEQGIKVDAVYFCPYHPEHGIGEYRVESYDRKPNPGMILRAQAELGLDLAASALVGDKASDVAAAEAAGVGRIILLAPNEDICVSANVSRVPTLAEASETLFGPCRHIA